ncbi:hypothetical protein DFH06DRAFT_1131401 [Mycena polygramma]|nr:hypothetical protein DFH06DRAFT_1131401 [Mycena polygramma]
MARVFLPLISFLFLSQALAAPLSRRAIPSNPSCIKLVADAANNVITVRQALATINPLYALPFLRRSTNITAPLGILNAQIALFNASEIAGPFTLSLDVTNPDPVDPNSSAQFLAAVQAAQTALAGEDVLVGANNATTTVIQQANSTLSQAVSGAQQAVDLKCVTLAAPSSSAAAPASTGKNFGS